MAVLNSTVCNRGSIKSALKELAGFGLSLRRSGHVTVGVFVKESGRSTTNVTHVTHGT